MPMLVPTLLLLQLASLLRLGSATSTVGTSNGSCTQVSCGNLNISYAFSLSGAQSLYCSYPAFDLACDSGRAYLSNTLRERLFHVSNISYANNSMVSAVKNAFAGNSSCPVPDFNVSASLALFPFNISATNNRLVFFYNCTVPADLQLQRPCGNHRMGAYISVQWNGGRPPTGVPWNCSSVSMPVRGGMERPHLHYATLIAGGFLLELPRPLRDYAAEEGGQGWWGGGGIDRGGGAPEEGGQGWWGAGGRCCGGGGSGRGEVGVGTMVVGKEGRSCRLGPGGGG